MKVDRINKRLYYSMYTNDNAFQIIIIIIEVYIIHMYVISYIYDNIFSKRNTINNINNNNNNNNTNIINDSININSSWELI